MVKDDTIVNEHNEHFSEYLTGEGAVRVMLHRPAQKPKRESKPKPSPQLSLPVDEPQTPMGMAMCEAYDQYQIGLLGPIKQEKSE